MTDNTMTFLNALLKRGGGDFIQELAEKGLFTYVDLDGDGKPRHIPSRRSSVP